jgi:hypothetical protein
MNAIFFLPLVCALLARLAPASARLVIDTVDREVRPAEVRVSRAF